MKKEKTTQKRNKYECPKCGFTIIVNKKEINKTYQLCQECGFGGIIPGQKKKFTNINKMIFGSYILQKKTDEIFIFRNLYFFVSMFFILFGLILLNESFSQDNIVGITFIFLGIIIFLFYLSKIALILMILTISISIIFSPYGIEIFLLILLCVIIFKRTGSLHAIRDKGCKKPVQRR